MSTSPRARLFWISARIEQVNRYPPAHKNGGSRGCRHFYNFIHAITGTSGIAFSIVKNTRRIFQYRSSSAALSAKAARSWRRLSRGPTRCRFQRARCGVTSPERHMRENSSAYGRQNNEGACRPFIILRRYAEVSQTGKSSSGGFGVKGHSKA